MPTLPSWPIWILNPDFFFGAQAILQLGSHPLHAADLAALRGALADRGLGLHTVLSDNPATVEAAKSLGIGTSLPKREVKELPFSTELQGMEAIFLQQTLRSGNSIHFPGHVTVLGDINPGAEIIAGGSIIVWGRLRGTAHAGAQGDEFGGRMRHGPQPDAAADRRPRGDIPPAQGETPARDRLAAGRPTPR